MIRRKGPNGYLLITQNDHAALAGQLAARWGNSEFPVPHPREAVVQAVEQHDAGWSLQDGKPTLNARKIPAVFYELPAELHARIWVASVSAAAARGGPMAGLIVSWHFTALSSSLLEQETLGDVARNTLLNFLVAQRLRQKDYCQVLNLSPGIIERPHAPANEHDRAVLYNLCVLRACDWISLMVCDDALSDPLNRPPQELEWGYKKPATAVHGDDGTLHLDPWPFEVEELSVSVPARCVPKGRYRKEADLLRVYEQAEIETLTFALAPLPVPATGRGPVGDGVKTHRYRE